MSEVIERFVCPESHPHDGTMNCYNKHHCRCDPCVTNKVEYNFWWRNMTQAGKLEPRRVDATGTRRRLRALMRVGWTLTQLAEHVGGSKQNVVQIANKTFVHRETARIVSDAYDNLWDKEPPGGRSIRGMARAANKGWPPPLAWDDDTIDDPHFTPDMGMIIQPKKNYGLHARFDSGIIRSAVEGEKPLMSPRERRETIRILNERLWSAGRIAKWIGCNVRTVERVRSELELHVPNQAEILAAA